MPASRPLIRRAAALAAAAGAVALSVRALSRPRPEAGPRLVDWETVRRTARARSGQRVRLRPEEAARLAAGYDVVAAEMVPLMAEVCGTPPATIPRITVLDRHGFIDANLLIVQRLLEPVERLRGSIPETAITAFGRRLTSRYVGEVLGFMSQRVLGQYDPVLMLPGPPPPSDTTGTPGATGIPGATGTPQATGRAPSSLYLVESNVELLERGEGAPAEPLRRWLVLHEATHAWQFEAHPWLRAYIGGLMNALLASGLGDEPGGTRTSSLGSAALRRLGRGVAGQLRGIGQLQAVMSVLEGYSNLVMHRVGRGHIQGFDQLEEAFHRRQAQRTFLERLILAVTGIALKLRQYDLGERFAEALLAEGGYTLLNRVWEGPEMMPTIAELRAPDRWIARTRRHGGARRRSAD